MMNYDCVSINLKSQDKAIFSSKKEACEYFNSHFGDDILADLKEQEKNFLNPANVVAKKKIIKKIVQYAKGEKNPKKFKSQLMM